jgi:Zn-finger protein
MNPTRCEFGNHESNRLYARIDGKWSCNNCYNRHRYATIESVRSKRLAANTRWNKRNKTKMREYNRKSYANKQQRKREEKRTEGKVVA